MNNPASTIQEFADRLEDDISFITPLYALRPVLAASKLAKPPQKLPNPTTLHALIETITSRLSDAELPLDPSLPLLQTPDKTPLKPVRPRCSLTPLLPSQDVVNRTQAFPAYLSVQIEHLQRVSHYNYHILELTNSKTITHPANQFCDALISLLPNRRQFKARFGVVPTSSEAIALISALKAGREAVIPIGETTFVQARGGGEKLKTGNDATVKRILCRMDLNNGSWYQKFRTASCVAWLVIMLWCALVIGIGVWPDERSVQRALLDSANVLELGLVLAILSLGVGKEFWGRFGLLFGWLAWECEKDIIRDVGREGRDALMGGLLSGNLIDDLVCGFGIGEGIRLREWAYDARFGLVVGDKHAFCVRGRRWYRVLKEGEGKTFRYRLFSSGVRKAFVGVGSGVIVIDGGKEKEVV